MEGAGTAFSGEGVGTVFSGEGVGTVFSGEGVGTVFSGEGAGTVFGGEGAGTASGGEGVGTVFSGEGAGTAFGGEGAGTVFSGEGAGTAFGGEGAGTVCRCSEFSPVAGARVSCRMLASRESSEGPGVRLAFLLGRLLALVGCGLAFAPPERVARRVLVSAPVCGEGGGGGKWGDVLTRLGDCK